ncbi:MAG: hypothetical protein HWN80_09355 [Candidatus Lokiarchaeota archaeon]|nr:hypothetical protein [Candidatus Lokiarchaeota archaeon]
MTNQKKAYSEIRSELESELFAIVNTIISLNQKYQSGNLKDNFFQRSIKSAMNDLLKINLSLNKNNIELSKFLANMNITDDYYKAIEIINKLSSLNISTNQFSKSTSSSILEIPKLTSEITSSFITIMDALKLETFDNNEIIFDLIKDLKKNFDRFPGLELSKVKLSKIYQEFLKNGEQIVNHQKLRDSVADDLYNVFKEFKEKLNL